MIQHRGHPFPLGATVKAKGVNFALYSESAERVELCFFDEHDAQTFRCDLLEKTNDVWHGFFPDIKAGQRYGYRVYGPWNPQEGLRFNSHKLLIDPYAKATSGPVQWGPEVFAYEMGHPNEDLSFDKRDSAGQVPKSIVVDDRFDWGDSEPPEVPWHETVIYETHVKGLTKLHPNIPEELRGTYAGLAHPVMIDYFKKLGVTSIELLPIQQFVADNFLKEKGLTNYWGYSKCSSQSSRSKAPLNRSTAIF